MISAQSKMKKLGNPDGLVKKAVRKAGAYYQPPDLFYQRQWRSRLQQIGFRVISIERLPHHPVWDIRLQGTLTAQTYLLVSKPTTKKVSESDNLLLKQMRAEVQEIAKQLGQRIESDALTVQRKATYVRVTFVWPLGKPGILRPKEKKAQPFSFFIKPWLRRIRD